MKFTITESEKNEIRGLYNLNEQGFLDAFKTGEDTAEKMIKMLPKSSEPPTELAFKGERASTVEDIYKVNFIGKPISDGNFIKFRVKETEKTGLYDAENLREYTIIYDCSSRRVTREDDGKELYVIRVSGARRFENYLDYDNNVNPDVDSYFKQFCDV